MRPINLIPSDDQSGRVQARAGSLSYIVLGVLAAVLVAVTAVVLTNNRISDGKAEISALERERDAAQARAESLQAFADFSTMQEQRTDTVVSLAQSRFDWERVLNELALVIPSDVWLVKLAGKVNPTVALDQAAEVQIRQSVPGPALEIVGCAPGQDALAGFIADLEDIDGVTRVGVASSERPEPTDDEGGAATELESGDANEGDGECRTEDFITRFEIVVAFDAVPTPTGATSAPGVPAPLANSFSEVAGQQAQQAANQAEVAQGSAQAADAAGNLPGG